MAFAGDAFRSLNFRLIVDELLECAVEQQLCYLRIRREFIQFATLEPEIINKRLDGLVGDFSLGLRVGQLGRKFQELLIVLIAVSIKLRLGRACFSPSAFCSSHLQRSSFADEPRTPSGGFRICRALKRVFSGKPCGFHRHPLKSAIDLMSGIRGRKRHEGLHQGGEFCLIGFLLLFRGFAFGFDSLALVSGLIEGAFDGLLVFTVASGKIFLRFAVELCPALVASLLQDFGGSIAGTSGSFPWSSAVVPSGAASACADSVSAVASSRSLPVNFVSDRLQKPARR
jgi:hypothetical protein